MSDLYVTLKELGRGGEGVVNLVRKVKSTLDMSQEVDAIPVVADAGSAETEGKAEGPLFVMKRRYCENIDTANAALQEAITMVRCTSDDVVGFVDVFLEPKKEFGVSYYYLCLVMDYCDSGDLAEWIRDHPLSAGAASEDEADTHQRFHFARDLLTGLADVADHGLAHRDIKAENVFLQSVHGATHYKCLLGDFGLAVNSGRKSRVSEQKRTDVAGTGVYMSPEVTQGSAYDTKADVWSLGCVLLELATSHMLPASLAERAIEAGSAWDPTSVTEEVPPHLSFLADLIHTMLRLDPAERPTADLLRHRLVASMDGEESQMSATDSTFEENYGDVLVRVLVKRDQANALEVCAAGLQDDSRLFPPGSDEKIVKFGREVYFPTIMSWLQKNRGFVYGAIRGNKPIGVALILGPDTKKKPPMKKIITILLRTMLTQGSHARSSARRLKDFAAMAKSLREHEIQEEPNSFVLHSIFVGPEARNQGIGSKLLIPALRSADQLDVPCCCFTANEGPKDFLEKNGFEVRRVCSPETDKRLSIKYWVMYRPRASEAPGRTPSSGPIRRAGSSMGNIS